MKSLVILIITSTFLVGCSNVKNIPPGYVSKILTSNGWQEATSEAGQVDIGKSSASGFSNRLVLCEATAVTIKESFGGATTTDPEDHRVRTSDPNGAPFTADVRLQVIVPTDKKLRDSIFQSLTAEQSPSDSEIYTITLARVYDQFGKSVIRNKIRSVFLKYKNFDECQLKYDQLCKDISTAVADAFVEKQIPLRLLSADLSNIQPDRAVVESQNQNQAAFAKVKEIEAVGEAMRKNPAYLEKYKWDVIRESAAKGSTIIIDAGRGNVGTTIPLKQ
ncbi:MAG: hypothetical protein WCI55_06060 [Armatimonadota bacterium]